jgi:hypothetical protein
VRRDLLDLLESLCYSPSRRHRDRLIYLRAKGHCRNSAKSQMEITGLCRRRCHQDCTEWRWCSLCRLGRSLGAGFHRELPGCSRLWNILGGPFRIGVCDSMCYLYRFRVIVYGFLIVFVKVLVQHGFHEKKEVMLWLFCQRLWL